MSPRDRHPERRVSFSRAIRVIRGFCDCVMSLHGKRLVIFGCGYVGSALAEVAQADGAKVEALTRNADKAAALRARGVRVVVADLASAEWHSQISSGPDYIVNCVSSGGPEHYRASYVGGMKSILEWAGKGIGPAGTFVYTSSTAVYPQGGGAVVDETADAPGSTPNGAIIRESELLLQSASVSTVRRHFILRLAGIYGPGRHHLLDQLRAGLPVLGGSGDHRLNLAHRDDIVGAIVACLNAPASVGSEIFNVADSAPAPRAEVVAWLSAELGRPAPTFDGSTTLRRGGAPMPDRIIGNAKLQRTLGWRPRFADYRAGFAQILGNRPAGSGSHG
jgi:nucleoside-diphosphate-sugar epimerase